MIRKLTAAMLGATALAAAGIAWARADHDPPPPQVTFLQSAHSIPFTLFRGNRIAIPATINGHRTEFMLDTGASATTVDQAYAKSIGLTGGQKIKAYGAGGVVDAEIFPNVTVEVGGMRFDKMTVAVMDLQPIARALGRPLNVVLGREFFNSAVVSIDWARNQLEVSSHDAFKSKAGATELPLKKKGPFNTIEVSMAGLPPIEALFDLGNGGALTLPKTYWGEHPELSGLRFAEARGGGVGGLHPARATLVPQVRLGGSTFAAVPATLGEGGNNHDPEKMANVGIGLLKQFHIDLDLGRNRVYLQPRSDAPGFDRDRSGTRLELVGDKLKVAFVSPQGPAAAAGLKEGDEIVAVDGRRVTADYYKDADWTRGSAGKAVHLRKADGSEVTVTLRDYY